MDSSIKKNRKPATTPAKESRSPHGFQSKVQKSPSNVSENANPNVSLSISMVDSTSSPLAKSGGKSHKSGQKIPNSTKTLAPYSLRNKLQQRKFVVAKKKKNLRKEEDKASSSSDSVANPNCKCKGGIGSKCLCVAYESLRASQEEFFKIRNEVEEMEEENRGDDLEVEQEESMMMDDGSKGRSGGEGQGSSTMKRRREKFLVDVRNSVSNGGKVMHLVKAFEKLLTEPEALKDCVKEEDEAEEGEEEKCSSFCLSEIFLTSGNLGLDSKLSVSSSWDASKGSVAGRKSSGGRRSRRNSSESCATMGGSRWKKKQQKVTSLKPFKLRTERRGKTKEEEFMKKIHEMMTEEERQRIPIAQGLPWTTDEPEHLIKPPVKEITRPIDLMLHSDIRAEERAKFDHQVSEKLTFIEEYKMERERLQKLVEEEEVRRLSKELVPKAQPMPYFDRPFIPRRSMKQPTVPKEPRFHIPQHKKIKCCSSFSDLSTFTFHH